MDKDDILHLAHRTAWRYKKSSDPNQSDTYTFNEHTLMDFLRKIQDLSLGKWMATSHGGRMKEIPTEALIHNLTVTTNPRPLSIQLDCTLTLIDLKPSMTIIEDLIKLCKLDWTLEARFRHDGSGSLVVVDCDNRVLSTSSRYDPGKKSDRTILTWGLQGEN